MTSDALLKGVATAISKTKADIETQIASVRRDVKNDLTSILSRDWSGDLVKDWREQRSYRPGDLVRYKGGVWQAWTDTDQHPLSVESGWVCLQNGIDDVTVKYDGSREVGFTVSLSDGTSKTYGLNVPVPVHTGKWEATKSYAEADEVAWSGSTWRSTEDSNTTEPGTEGHKWLLVAQKGSTGRVGPQGERGERGEKGDKGDDANPLTVARIIERNIAEALDNLAETGEIPESAVAPIVKAIDRISRERFDETKNIFNVAEPSDDRIPIYSRGLYVKGEEYRRGDMVSITALGIYVALTTTRQDPRSNHPDWQTFAVFPHALGAIAAAPPTPSETVTYITYNSTTRTLTYTNEALTVQTFVFAETNTTIVYNSVTNILTYTNETGATFAVDLSALAANVYVNGASFNAATNVITFTDTSAATPNVSVDLSAYSPSLVNNLNGTYTHTVGGNSTLIDLRRSFSAIPSTRNYDGRVIELNGLLYKYLATPGTYIQIS